MYSVLICTYIFLQNPKFKLLVWCSHLYSLMNFHRKSYLLNILSNFPNVAHRENPGTWRCLPSGDWEDNKIVPFIDVLIVASSRPASGTTELPIPVCRVPGQTLEQQSPLSPCAESQASLWNNRVPSPRVSAPHIADGKLMVSQGLGGN